MIIIEKNITMKYILTLLIALVSTLAFSQNTFTADRPGQTISAFTLPAGTFQLEAGLTYSGPLIGDDDDIDRLYSLPTVMIRYGVLDFLELRLENSYQILDSHFYPTEKGLADFKLGFKVNLRKNEIHKTNYAFIGYVTFPQDDSPIGFSQHTAGLTFAVNHQWGERLSSAFNLGTIRDSNDIFHLIYSFSTSMAISQQFSIFAEVYADSFEPEYEYSRTAINYNIGASYLLSDKFQMDAFYGTGDSIQMNSFNVGFSWRIF